MLTKSQEKYINSLRIKKYRELHHAFIAEGEKLATEFLQSDIPIQQIIATATWMEKNPKSATQASEVIEVSEVQMEKLSELKTPSSVLLVAEIPEYEIEEDIITQHLSLLLEQVQDPGNLGTIIRIADWFGIPYVFCSPDSVDAYNSKVVQASMGSITRVKVIETDLLLLMLKYPELPSYASVINAEDIFTHPLSDTGFIVIGNESRGVSATLRNTVKDKISIPSFGKAESLNAAVAAGIICAQFRSKG